MWNEDYDAFDPYEAAADCEFYENDESEDDADYPEERYPDEGDENYGDDDGDPYRGRDFDEPGHREYDPEEGLGRDWDAEVDRYIYRDDRPDLEDRYLDSSYEDRFYIGEWG